MAHTILVADDSKTIRRAIEIAFEKEAFDVVSVADGASAVAKAKTANPSVVLADHVMPGQDGYAVAQALKADPATASIPVLILSGTAADFDEAKCAASGAVGHIKKPFECTALVNKVREAAGIAAPADALPTTAPLSTAHLKPVSTGPIVKKPSGPVQSPFASASAPPAGQQNPFAASTPSAPTSPRPDPFGLGAQPAPAQADPFAAAQAAAVAAQPAPVAAQPVAPATPAPSTPAPVEAAPAAVSVAAAAQPQVAAQLAAAGIAGNTDINAATREIIERVVWEVVPELAETIIREELARLLADK